MPKNKIKFKNIEDLPVRITDWVGSTASIVIHTIFFVVVFALRYLGVATTEILLILTTVVSLEAIYLAIFIQMTVNRNTQSLEAVEEDIDKLEEEEAKDDVQDAATTRTLNKIETDLQRLLDDIAKLRQT